MKATRRITWSAASLDRMLRARVRARACARGRWQTVGWRACVTPPPGMHYSERKAENRRKKFETEVVDACAGASDSTRTFTRAIILGLSWLIRHGDRLIRRDLRQ